MFFFFNDKYDDTVNLYYISRYNTTIYLFASDILVIYYNTQKFMIPPPPPPKCNT